MVDLQTPIDSLLQKLHSSDISAQEKILTYAEQSQAWEGDKNFAQQVIRRILDYWHKLLIDRLSCISTAESNVKGLQYTIFRTNAFTSSISIHPKVLQKRAEILLINILCWLKQILFLVIRIIIYVLIFSIAIGLIYLLIRFGIFIVGWLKDALQNLIQMVQPHP